MTIIKNLTPHTLNIHHPTGVETVPASGEVARVSVEYREAGVVAWGIPVYKAEYGEVTGLPEPEAGTIYVVSGMVQSQVPHRADVYSPGDLVRDAEGRPVGCKGLKQ